jgi:ATP-dependent DNA helicase PIF1
MYSDYIELALTWHDGRFARHPRFRYVIFNTLMRQQTNIRSSYLIKHQEQGGNHVTVDI